MIDQPSLKGEKPFLRTLPFRRESWISMYLSDLVLVFKMCLCAVTPRELLDALYFEGDNSAEMLTLKNIVRYVLQILVLTVLMCLLADGICQMFGLDSGMAMSKIQTIMFIVYAAMMTVELVYYLVHTWGHPSCMK